MCFLDDGKSANSGLITLASVDMITRLRREPSLVLLVSFFEIYSGKLFDLLNDRRSLAAREDAKQNVVIVGLKEKAVRVAPIANIGGPSRPMMQLLF